MADLWKQKGRFPNVCAGFRLLDLARNGIRVAGQGVGTAGGQQRLGSNAIPGVCREVRRRRQPGQVPGSRGRENINPENGS